MGALQPRRRRELRRAPRGAVWRLRPIGGQHAQQRGTDSGPDAGPPENPPAEPPVAHGSADGGAGSLQTPPPVSMNVIIRGGTEASREAIARDRGR